jgi:polar amino acid transport system substrate-binding protein
VKRLSAVVIVLAISAAALTAGGVAAPSQRTGAPIDTAKEKLPTLPAEVRRRGEWIVGVKCDTPPFGYTDRRGRYAGYDVAIARWFARFAFGSARRVRFECVTTATHVPALASRRVDIVAGVTWFPMRAQQIDFSTPYYAEEGRLLVRKGTTLTLRQLPGKTVTTTGGSIYDTWLQTCFRQTTRLTFQGTAPPLLAVKDGRADAFMYDESFLLEYVQRDPEVRLTRELFARAPWGIGIRTGERAMRRWVNSRLELLRQRNRFARILRAHTSPSFFTTLRSNVPTPRRRLRYPRATSAEEMLPCPR